MTMTGETQKAAIVAVLLIALLALGSRHVPQKPVGNDYPDAMVIVPPTGMGASVELDKWAAENNIELRRYTEGVDLENAENWIPELYQATEGSRPAAAIRRDGQVIVLPIDDDILERLKELR